MLHDRAIIFGVAALTAVATAGWVRQPQAAVPAPQALTVPVNSFTAPAGSVLDPAYAPAPLTATPVSATVVPVHSGVYRQVSTPVAENYPGAVQQPSARAPRSNARYRNTEPELRQRPTTIDRDEEYDYDREPAVKKERSTMKSVAIVGGSAAAGAAIGGIAGGGKGAAIGALSGGAAGLIYDRITKNR